MKQILSLTLFLIAILFTSQINASSTVNNLKATTKVHVAMEQDINKLKLQWGQLFSVARGGACTSETFLPDASKDPNMVEDVNDPDAVQSGWGLTRPSFNWVKKWGFGDAAYLIDYLEPAFLANFKLEANHILTTFSKIDKKNTEEYKDSFDLKLIAPKGNNLLSDADFKQISKKFSKSIWEKSVNTCQLNKSIPLWGYYTPEDADDFAYDMVAKYDMNGDGRLNARETILAVIWNNKKRDNLFCHNCFFLLGKQLGAAFAFLDCEGKGYLTAEDMWEKLPSIKRGSDSYNIFKIPQATSIRTSAVNDFILKNGYTVDGGVTRNEFISGVLLGMWDRNVVEEKVLAKDDDSRAMKKLRWTAKKTDIRAAAVAATLKKQKK
jgi:Ca2+-binding EF-hand superfamily protein